ncbi:MAG: hypothetical protein A3H49_07500 [Nitrospirae bacterium RIFCSPLOWO2_02_FULL_62_14]|nr:MAG: hypothetical protein A3H49_07500 [Nitrospirae bacterium RIFCSPLOWO2_02_FULL_62_14]
MLIIFLAGAGGGKQAHAATDPNPASVSPQLLKGEIIMLSEEVCVVKDATGKTMMFKINKETKIGKSVKEGQIVEVSASADGVALSIK